MTLQKYWKKGKSVEEQKYFKQKDYLNDLKYWGDIIWIAAKAHPIQVKNSMYTIAIITY